MAEPRRRLLKVTLCVTYVLDDGETLEEQTTEPKAIPAREWPAWARRDPLEWLGEEQE